jgi:hypothetical protein
VNCHVEAIVGFTCLIALRFRTSVSTLHLELCVREVGESKTCVCVDNANIKGGALGQYTGN